MTTTTILATGTAGILLLLLVVTIQLVQTLKQTRQTARSLERYLAGTRPKVEEAIDRLGSLLRRTDNIIATAEKSAGRLGILAGPPGAVAAGLNAIVRNFATLATLAGGISQVLRMFTSRRSPETRQTKGGNPHE